jgi:plasmid stability protein
MGQMLVRNLDDSVIEGLKRRAMERGTSLEQIAREILTAAAAQDARAAWAARAKALRAQVPFDPSWDSVAVIREWRDRDRLTRMYEEREAEAAARRGAAEGGGGDSDEEPPR